MMKVTRQMPPIIFFSGIDGSGKTVVIENLIKELNQQGFKTRYVWMRYNHYLSKLLLAVCRLTGFTKYHQIAGHKLGVHHFYRSRIISYLFIFSSLIDTAVATFLKLLLFLNRTDAVIVCDRFVIDILVDLMIDTRKFDLFDCLWGQAFKRLVAPHARTFYIRRPLKEIIDVRPESEYDTTFLMRVVLYEHLVRKWKIETIDNAGSLADVHKDISSRIGIQ